MPGNVGYCSKIQKYTLIKLLRDETQLMKGKFTNSFTFKDAQRKWQRIAVHLNSIPGATKDWRHWRKTWHDLRSKAKTRKCSLSKSASEQDMTCTNGTEKVNTIENILGSTLLPNSYETAPSLNLNPVSPECYDASDFYDAFSESKSQISLHRLKNSLYVTKKVLELAERKAQLRKQEMADRKEYFKKVLDLKRRKVEALEKIADSLAAK